VHIRLGSVVRRFVERNIVVAEDRARFDAAVKSARRVRDTLSGTDALMRTNRRPKLFHFIWDDGHSRTFVAVRALEPEETFAVEVDEDAEASCWSAHLTIASPRTATAKGRRPRWPPMPAHISFPRWTTSTPSYVRHQLSVSASQLSALIELGSLAFHQPIVISRNGIVVDGYARWELAQRQGRRSILCLEYELTEEEALAWLIQTHRPLHGLNS